MDMQGDICDIVKRHVENADKEIAKKYTAKVKTVVIVDKVLLEQAFYYVVKSVVVKKSMPNKKFETLCKTMGFSVVGKGLNAMSELGSGPLSEKTDAQVEEEYKYWEEKINNSIYWGPSLSAAAEFREDALRELKRRKSALIAEFGKDVMKEAKKRGLL